MVSFNTLAVVCLLYVALLFGVAFAAERQARKGSGRWLNSPIVYTLSLSIYCTAWTFYGAVGYAARSGLEFVTIYLGPTLVLIGWWWIFRRLVQIARSQRITSIADLISSRYGKSNALGVLVTLIAVVGTTPYIALQLQSVALSFSAFTARQPSGFDASNVNATAIWVALGLAIFTILFGTRNVDANERHHGIVTAIAVEAIVKLVALVAVGIFVVWWLADGPNDVLARIDLHAASAWQVQPSRWMTLIFLSAAAFLCLPRMFQVTVVENSDDRQLATASWAFPLYLMLMSLFVIPIAVVGLSEMPSGSNPDLFVLTLPLSNDAEGLALLSFLGGFSSATSMVIVASIALSTMVSNHIVLPLWLNSTERTATHISDFRTNLLLSRRVAIGAILGLGYVYFRVSGGGEALASIGLISFTGVAQFLPAMIGGIFWRGATKRGAITGLIVGFLVWGYTMFLPSFGESAILSAQTFEQGAFGISWLQPRALFGLGGMDPLVHAVFWSISLNTLAFVMISVLDVPGPIERLQGAQFVNVFENSKSPVGWASADAKAEELLAMSQAIIGVKEAQRIFQREAESQGRQGFLPDVTTDFIEKIERELAGSVGAATAHAMLGQIIDGVSVSVNELMAVADETAHILEHSNQLEVKSEELAKTARQLRDANEKLTAISVQKDAFLGQVSHELRTPMTSIRAFSEILMNDPKDLPQDALEGYAKIIHDESLRLTRLLDDLLDLSSLEQGQIKPELAHEKLGELIARACLAVQPSAHAAGMKIVVSKSVDTLLVNTNADRLVQVLINIIGNSAKYGAQDSPVLHIQAERVGDMIQVDFVDNGPGIPVESQEIIFEKFARASNQKTAGGVGLGLAISREIMTRLEGDIRFVPGQGGAAFRLTMPGLSTQKA